MKILLASDTWSPMVNGVVRSVELLYHQLLALGHDVRVVTLAQNGHSHEENGILYVGSISAERVYPGVRISAAGALPISHWLDELEAWGPEVIHTQSEFSTFMLAQRVARRCHCPVVHTYHTVYEDYTQYLFFSERLGRMTAEKATRILSGYCSLMLAPTEKVRAMLNRYGVSCPVVTVPTGIDLTAFGPAQDNGEEKARMRAELGIPEGDTVLLSLGRLAAEKNHAQLVRLLAAQPEQSRPWLVFVGDGPARPDLEALTKELKLTDRVRFVGMVKPDEVPRWYRVGDIFVLPLPAVEAVFHHAIQAGVRTAERDPGSDLLRGHGLRSAGALPCGPLPGWRGGKRLQRLAVEGRSRVCIGTEHHHLGPRPARAAAPERSGHRGPLLGRAFRSAGAGCLPAGHCAEAVRV